LTAFLCIKTSTFRPPTASLTCWGRHFSTGTGFWSC